MKQDGCDRHYDGRSQQKWSGKSLMCAQLDFAKASHKKCHRRERTYGEAGGHLPQQCGFRDARRRQPKALYGRRKHRKYSEIERVRIEQQTQRLPNGPPLAESVGIELARSLGVDGTDKDALDKLRSLSAEKVLGNLNMATMNQPGYAGPFIDGRVVVSDPQSVYLFGAGWHVPLMIGTNSMDIGFGFARNKEELFAPFGADREKAIAAYDPTGKGNLRTVQYEVSMDRFMVEPARFVASVFASEGACLPIQVFLRRKVHAQQMAGRAPCHRDTFCLRYRAGEVWNRTRARG
jgi:hypothetical protein